MATRLPTPGGDTGDWGTILNSFLEVAHNSDGTLQSSAISAAGGVTNGQIGTANGVAGLNNNGQIPSTQLGSGIASNGNFLRGDGTWAVPSGGSSTLASDTDVSISSPVSNQVLTYNSSTSKWVNQSSSGGVSLDTTSSDIQPLGTRAAGSTGLAADAGHVHAMPRLDQISNPTASVSLNSQKITNIANGASATDAAAFGQIPTVGTGSTNYTAGNASVGGDLSGTLPNPTVTATHLSAALPINQGGTGSGTQNFVDLTNNQTIAGSKTFSSTIAGNISGNAASATTATSASTVTTIPALTGDVTSSGSSNATTVAKVQGVSVSGTPSSGQALIASSSSAAAWTTPPYITRLSASGDVTGATDTANMNAAIAGLASGNGKIMLAAGTYYWMCGDVTNPGPRVFIEGAGVGATFVRAVGTGDTIWVYDSNSYSTGSSGSGFGGISGITFDGTGAGAGSVGLHAGDIYQYKVDIAVQNFTGSGSMGVHFDNHNYWTEQLHGSIYAQNCTSHVVFDVSGATTSTNSFARTDLDIYIAQGNATYDGVVLQNGAVLYDGHLSIRGNFLSSSTAVSSAVLRLTGTVPVGHPAAGGYSLMFSMRLDLQVECPNGTYTPQTIVENVPGSNFIRGCTGILDFAGGGPYFTQSNLLTGGLLTPGAIWFHGPVYGDGSLNPASSGGNNSTPIMTLGPTLHTRGAASYSGSIMNIYTHEGDYFLPPALTQATTISLSPTGSTLGASQRVTIILTQASSGGPWGVTWPSNASPTTTSPTIVWAGGVSPVMSSAAGAVDVYMLETINGKTWYGYAIQAQPSTASISSASPQTFTGNVSAPAIIASGLTGATAASRYVGATASGAPASGTFVVGDFVIDQTGTIWICTSAGSPGIWTEMSSGSSNPMTTLGDLIYENSTPTPARLAGNTSTTKNFLTQTGTGSVSAAPSWGTIALSDLPYNVTWVPGDIGLLAATCDPAVLRDTSVMVAGSVYLVKLQIRQTMTISYTCWDIAGAGNNTGGSTGTYTGLYSSSGTLLSGSSDVAASLTSLGLAKLALTTPQVVSAGSFVWLTLLVNLGTTQPTLLCAAAQGNPKQSNIGLTAATYRHAINGTTQTTLPSPSITPSSNSQTNALLFWAGVA